jgi:hypothetical protein
MPLYMVQNGGAFGSRRKVNKLLCVDFVDVEANSWFDYSPPAAHPSGASATSALFNAFGVSPGPGTTI